MLGKDNIVDNQIKKVLQEGKNTLLNAQDHFLSNKDEYGITFCRRQLTLNNTLIRLLSQSVRFDYLTIQKDIDALYKKDNSLSGVMIYLFWDKVDYERLGRLKYSINGEN